VDSWGAPEGVRGGHTDDQSLDLSVNLRATAVPAARELGPVLAEATRCHRRMVSGVTMTRAPLHPVQIWPARSRRGDQYYVAVGE
jgi:hypothetical protein